MILPNNMQDKPNVSGSLFNIPKGDIPPDIKKYSQLKHKKRALEILNKSEGASKIKDIFKKI